MSPGAAFASPSSGVRRGILAGEHRGVALGYYRGKADLGGVTV